MGASAVAGVMQAGSSARHSALSGLIRGRREALGLENRNMLNAAGDWKSLLTRSHPCPEHSVILGYSVV